MTEAPLSTAAALIDRSWRVWTSVFIGGFVLVCVILGFLILPLHDEAGVDAFTAICRSIGIPGYENSFRDYGVAKANAPASKVAWTLETNRLLSHANTARGAALAKDICGACHGEDGKSTDPTQYPVLAGQSEAAIFKELRDFQVGDRKSDIMEPVAQGVTEQQMADAAAYYAARTPNETRAADSAVFLKTVALAREGDPARAIPSCDSCHGPSHSGPEGAPVLLSQSAPYLEQQLKNFSTRERHNDIFERMRTIAHQLAPEEMHALAIYYQGMPTSN